MGAPSRSIIGIDPGSRSGWAVRSAQGAITEAGTFDSQPNKMRRYEGGGMRFVRFRRFIQELLAQVKPDLVVYEEVRRHMGTDAAHVYGGMVAVLTSECEAAGIPYTAVHFTKVKIMATGKGNASKEQMLAAANARWGLALAPKDENEADARWIAEAGAAL